MGAKKPFSSSYLGGASGHVSDRWRELSSSLGVACMDSVDWLLRPSCSVAVVLSGRVAACSSKSVRISGYDEAASGALEPLRGVSVGQLPILSPSLIFWCCPRGGVRVWSGVSRSWSSD